MTTFVVKFDLAVGVDNLLEDAAPQIRRKPVLWSCQRIKDSWRQEKVRNRVVGWSVTMVPHNFLKRDWSDPPSEVHKKQRTIGPPELSSCRSFILIAGHPRDKSCLRKIQKGSTSRLVEPTPWMSANAFLRRNTLLSDQDRGSLQHRGIPAMTVVFPQPSPDFKGHGSCPKVIGNQPVSWLVGGGAIQRLNVWYIYCTYIWWIYMVNLGKYTSWWFQPIWKNMSQIETLPQSSGCET